jgi:hypothetical protein
MHVQTLAKTYTETSQEPYYKYPSPSAETFINQSLKFVEQEKGVFKCQVSISVQSVRGVSWVIQ